MVSYYRSRVVYPNRKQEARKRVAGFVFFAFCVFAIVGLFGFGLYSFAQLEKFRIKNISVEGARALSQDEIRIVAEDALGGSFFFIIPRNHYVFAQSRHLAETLPKKFPRIRTASVKKIFPDGIKIIIEERTEWGIYCGEISNLLKQIAPQFDGASKSQISNQSGDDTATSMALGEDDAVVHAVCGYIDRKGVLFEYPFEVFGTLLPVISDNSLAEIREGDAVVSRDAVSFFEAARNRAKQELGISFIELGVMKELPDDYRLYSNEGWYVLAPRLGDQALWFNPLKALMEHELKNRVGLEYIDARFGNKLFYKKK